MAAPSLSFPTDPAQFEADERISFSRVDNKHIAVHDDGTEFEFDTQLKRWIPAADEEELRQQQQRAYGGAAADRDGTGAEAGAGEDNDDAQNKRKRKEERSEARKRQKQQQQKQAQPRQNTAIYVTGLPPDATADEVAEVFSRKCGVIAEEIDSGRPRIKLYSDGAGRFKGDALVVFFKPQSVDMAIMLLDDTDFRYSASGLPSGRMRVQAADASYKKVQYEPGAAGGGGEDSSAGGTPAGNGNGASEATERTATTAGATTENGRENGSSSNNNNSTTSHSKPKTNREREQEKQKIIKRTQKLDAKLADWDDDDPSDQPYASQLETGARNERVVVLRHMFTLAELEEDPAAMLDIKEDIREECAKLGDVTNVVLYDLEPEGVASVRFADPAAAAACVRLMDGRAFDGRVVRAEFSAGKERFRKSGKGGPEAEV